MSRLFDLSVMHSDIFWKDELFGLMLKLGGNPLPTILSKLRLREEDWGFCWRSWLVKSSISWLELSFWFVMIEETFGCIGS